MGSGVSTLRKKVGRKKYSSDVVRTTSFHENLVRQRDRRADWESIYDVLEEIGHSGFGICSVYKIKKNERSIGGSSHRENCRPSGALRRLSSSLTIKNKLCHSPSTSSTSSSLSMGSPESMLSLASKVRFEDLEDEVDDERGESDIVFAMKMINLALVPADRIDQLKNEVEILKSLDHKNIIKAYETFPVKADKRLPIIMELCTGGDLHARFPYTESQAADITKQILCAVSYIHDRNIVHRDIKLENIVFESKHPDALVKVIDFGLSKQYSMDDPVLTERVGTLYSMSPETMKGIYTTKADMWSVGVCTYMLLSNGEKPFEGKTPKEVVSKVLMGNYSFDDQLWDDISQEAKAMISSLLKVNPEDRAAARNAKHDQWFSTRAVRTRRSESKLALIERVQEAIINFANTGEFRKLALNVIAQKSTTKEIFQLRKIFDEFDVNNTGTITLDEFKAALDRFDYSDEEIEKIFRKVDVNRNNEINYTEFLAASLETQGKISEHRYAEAFDLMDSDDTGYISRANLRQILGKQGDERYIDRLMAEADLFHDGKISYEEFLRVLSAKEIGSIAEEPVGDGGILSGFGLAESVRSHSPNFHRPKSVGIRIDSSGVVIRTSGCE